MICSSPWIVLTDICVHWSIAPHPEVYVILTSPSMLNEIPLRSMITEGTRGVRRPAPDKSTLLVDDSYSVHGTRFCFPYPN